MTAYLGGVEVKTVRQGRRWIREHWAYLIINADMGAVGEMGNDILDEIWSDECRMIAQKLRGKTRRDR